VAKRGQRRRRGGGHLRGASLGQSASGLLGEGTRTPGLPVLPRVGRTRCGERRRTAAGRGGVDGAGSGGRRGSTGRPR
jgi:hypothetical protein